MIGEKLGSFRIEAILGTGAMGVVYRAMSETTNRPAAVKVISSEIGRSTKTYERFRREAEILQQFRHPNIVRFLALGRYKGTSYFAMEYVPGETLEQLLERRGPLPWREVVDLAIQICEALHYAHEHGVVHRDLKPSNLMVTAQGQVKLTDFGIAKDLDATALTATGRTLGTAAYMAPEQIRGTPAVSHKTDLYALGVVLYQMLTGRSPFEGPTAVVLMHAHLNEHPPRASAKTAEIPRALDDLIVKLMAKDPTERPWDAAAVGVALTELRDKAERGAPVAMVWSTADPRRVSPTQATADMPTKPRKASRTPRRVLPELNRATLEIALMVLALVAIVGFVGYQLWPPSAAYLYRCAERLMASEHRHDWIEARDSFLEPLDRRFPNNPYRATTQAWRDRILLDEASERAKRLDSPVKTAFSEPKTKGEHTYVAFSEVAGAASRRGDDPAAILAWEEMARQLDPKDTEQRPWFLLARQRAEELQKTVDRRREAVQSQLNQAELAERQGRPRDAMALRENLVSRYGKYSDAAKLLEDAGLKTAPPSTAPEPSTDRPPQEVPETGTPTP